MISVLKPNPRRIGRTVLAGAAATTLAGVIALGSAGIADAAPLPPALGVAVSGHEVTITMNDPNTGYKNVDVSCYPVLLDVVDAIPLLPALASDDRPPILEMLGATTWGPPVPGTSAAGRNKTWTISDVPSGIYVAAGVCVGVGGDSDPTIQPVLVGSTIQLGSAALDIGSVTLDTPGAIGAILDMAGIDVGSFGSSAPELPGSSIGSSGSGSGSGSGSSGSLGSSTGS